MSNVLVKHRVTGGSRGTKEEKHGHVVVPFVYMYSHRSKDGQIMVRGHSGDVWPVAEKTGIFDGIPYSYVTVAE